MRFFHKTLLLVSLFFIAQTQAFTPESGFWWNPDESGAGYTIEIQDNYMFLAAYVYDTQGNPIWYSAGRALGGNSLFDSSLNYTYDGTCIDCNYTPPITIQGDAGPITIDFLTETTATIQFGGAVKNIERFNYALGNELAKMEGEWQVVIDQSNLVNGYPYFADALTFNDSGYDSALGFDIVDGCRSESTFYYNDCTNYAYNNNSAIGYIGDDGLTYIVVEHDESYFLTYKLDTGLNQFDGEAYYYLRGTNVDLNAEGYIVRGFKSASRTYVNTGAGPSKKETVKNNKARVDTIALSKQLSDQELVEMKDNKTFRIIKQLETILTMNKKRLKK